MAEIVLDGVTKAFSTGEVLAVDDVSLEIESGEFLVLVGPSGCGKSTLLRMIAGLEDVSGGAILIDARDVTDLPPRARDIAMVFQTYALYPHMTVRENLGYGLKVRKTPKDEIARRVEHVAEMLGLEKMLDRRPAALSGGQRQRVAMGRAIVREPKAFLMDEPLSNLDAKLRVSMRAQLAALHSRLGTTTVYVTHDQVEAMTLGHRVAVMREGRILQVDTPQALYAEPRNLFVAAFIGSPAMNLVEAEVSSDGIAFGGFRIPASPPRAGERLIVGIRPEAFEDAAFGDPSLPQLDVEVQVVEDLGADTHVIFTVDAPPVDVSEVREAAGDEEVLLPSNRASFTARVDPQTSARVGSRLRLAVDSRVLQLLRWLLVSATALALAGPAAAGAPAGATIVSALAGPPNASFLARIRAGEMGGVILTHSWTPAAFAATTAKLHATSCEIGRPLLIFVDQEGGSIRRLTWAPPALSEGQLGRLGAVETLREASAAASALHAAGVDVDLAPVADTLGPGGFLGDRSFGSNSSLVGQLAATFIGALQSGGIAATAKHFPGLGAARHSTDDHIVSVLKTPLGPFQRAIDAGVKLVMVSNASYPRLDPSSTPAVFSHPIVSGLLRGVLGFRGAVVSDALNAPAPWRTPDAPGRALAAGVDLLLYTSGSAAHYGYEELVADAQRSAATRAQIARAVAHIRALRAWVGRSC